VLSAVLDPLLQAVGASVIGLDASDVAVYHINILGTIQVIECASSNNLLPGAYFERANELIHVLRYRAYWPSIPI